MLRLMFGSIISSFTEVNMDFLNIPEIFKSKLMKIIEIIKKSGQKKKKFYKKSDYFTHHHYTALFLHLNQENLETIRLSDKDRELHKSFYGLDLN